MTKKKNNRKTAVAWITTVDKDPTVKEKSLSNHSEDWLLKKLLRNTPVLNKY